MANSSRSNTRKSSSGTVTVIEARVRRSTARNAKVGGFLAGVFTGLLSMAVCTQWLHPVSAAFAGAAVGVAAGAVAWVAIRVWPFVRLLWWWSGELLALATVLVGWVQLCRTPFPVLVTVMALLAASFAFGRVRRVMASVGWCFVVRHRLRTCFAQFIVANQSGSLPLIFAAKPTPVGERVWIYLRPGLSPTDLQSRLEKIAVACHASAVTIERASARTAGFLRVDVKRREVLGALVNSPLTTDQDLVDTAPTMSAASPFDGINSAWARTDLSMPDAPVSPAPAPAAPAAATVTYRPTSTSASVKVPASVSGPGEDLTDYI